MSEMFDDNPAFDPQALEALLHDVPLEVTIELGRIQMNLSELAARLGPGSIITLDT
jgi:flagellar motor switch/type III secretory pathway protein FliN